MRSVMGGVASGRSASSLCRYCAGVSAGVRWTG